MLRDALAATSNVIAPDAAAGVAILFIFALADVALALAEADAKVFGGAGALQ